MLCPVQSCGRLTLNSRLRLLVLSGLLLAPLAAPAAPPNEIIISAANYAQTPPEVLEKLFRDPAELTEAPAPTTTASPLRHYQFLPGEVLESDLSYLEVCQLLVLR